MRRESKGRGGKTVTTVSGVPLAEEPLKELKKEDEDALPAEPDDTKPEDDAYLSETGRILLDYLSLSTSVAKH